VKQPKPATAKSAPAGAAQVAKQAEPKKSAGPATLPPEKIDHSKPALSDLPKTAKPIILYQESDQSLSLEKFPLFPDLRTFDGTPWTKEKTEIRMSTDGKKLFVHSLCHDSNAKGIVTEFSRNEGPASAYKDDSVELLVWKDRDTPSYFYYVCSASGIGHVAKYAATYEKYPGEMKPQELPTGFVKPVFNGEFVPGGYALSFEIDLSNVSASPFKPGDEILMQVVRNYHGIHRTDAESVLLQLFPNHIYCDNRLGRNNHDRRGFQPVVIQASAR
jgi:hypothetical protein